jgi:hypothetical protein
MATGKTSKRSSSEVPGKSSSSDASAKTPSAEGSAAATLNRAQAEYQRYMKRMETQRPGSGPAFMMPFAVTPGNEGMPLWAVPPSVAMLPHGTSSPGLFAPMPHGGTPEQSSLTTNLGATIRLGVDLINAALAGSVRLLSGISGVAYGYGEAGYGQSNCGHPACGCHASCDCCCDDCCACECCNPGVGTCC